MTRKDVAAFLTMTAATILDETLDVAILMSATEEFRVVLLTSLTNTIDCGRNAHRMYDELKGEISNE